MIPTASFFGTSVGASKVGFAAVVSSEDCLMGLLQPEENGDLSLVEHFGNSITLYAILSHTWGTDGENFT